MKQVHKPYMQCGLKIRHINADREFEPLRVDMADLRISLNCASKKEHIPDIERFDQTVKGRVQSAQEAMHFKNNL